MIDELLLVHNGYCDGIGFGRGWPPVGKAAVGFTTQWVQGWAHSVCTHNYGPAAACTYVTIGKLMVVLPVQQPMLFAAVVTSAFFFGGLVPLAGCQPASSVCLYDRTCTWLAQMKHTWNLWRMRGRGLPCIEDVFTPEVYSPDWI